ncbi:MAG: type II toxin-antitoxin system Phd/YefM family antitoxin [Streptosporangiaceae bacterium]
MPRSLAADGPHCTVCTDGSVHEPVHDHHSERLTSTYGASPHTARDPICKKVNEDHDAIEIVSRHGNAFLVSAEDYAALREGAYLLRSPANARRLLNAYENALNGMHTAEHALIDPDGDAGSAR